MKMLVHRTPVSSALPFDLADIKPHLRIIETDEDAAISIIAEAAAAEIESFAQIALLAQTIRVTVFDPFQEGGQALPIGPVADGDTPNVTIDGAAFTAFDFESGNRPYIRWQSEFFNLSPSRMTIEYTAGFGDTAADIPRDLAQAIMDQAALHYDGRSPMSRKYLTSSPHMARIGAKYRGVRA